GTAYDLESLGAETRQAYDLEPMAPGARQLSNLKDIISINSMKAQGALYLVILKPDKRLAAFNQTFD
ncbi:hypothetical protein BK139_06070, partial [Paenibacillus sp. FSL R5-0490]|uniref:hypothetical protein n=1 Tax=Paenibacillus sp. FSL R5-0490 TaxID=1920424 RepID=UPI00097ACA45